MKGVEAVRSEPIRALFEQGGPVLGAHASVGAIVVVTLWGQVPASHLTGWYACLLLMCAVRAAFQRRFLTKKPADGEMAAWGQRFVLGSIAAGALWGSAALLFFSPGNLLAQGLLTFAIGGLAAAAAGTLASHLPAFFGFFVPALGPLLLASLLVGGRFHWGMAAILVAYAAGMCRVAFNNHRAYNRALELGVTNAGLLVALSASDAELRDANRTLEDRVLSRTRTLERQSEALRQAQRLEVVGRLAGNLAHDFNSLLTVVINNAAQLAACPRLEEHERLAAEETLEAGRRGAALIRQLLAFSRRQRPEPRVFSLNDLTREWSELLPRVLGEGISVQTELASEPSLVRADPAYAEQALLNLVLGTRAAVTRAGRLKLLTRAPEPGSPHAELWVEHSPDEDATAVHSANSYLSFEADVRNETAGLPSVRATAAQWGGSVEMEEESKVVRYRLRFPTAAFEGEQPASTRAGATAVSQPQATVLVVDDEPTLRAVMRRALARDGHEVLVAEDGARALKLAASHASRIDLLLTDVVMPGVSGLELARRLTRERPELAVLYVSGFTFEEAMPSTDLANGTAYLPKPFDAATLTHKVRELLRASRAGRDATSSG